MADAKLSKAFYGSASGINLSARALAKAAGVSEGAAKKFLAKQEIKQLYEKVPKQAAKASIYVPQDNVVHQADLLSLPKDGDKKYALVVVDVHSRKVDAEPLADKSAATVLAALKRIYERHGKDAPLSKPPEKLAIDQGPEFKGSVDKYLKENKVFVVRGEKGRHRAQAYAEAANREIGKTLLKRMQAQELLTGEKSIEWVEDLPEVIEAMNKKRKPLQESKASKEGMPLDDGKDLLPDGAKVRIALEHPVNALTGEQLHGAFRAGDPKWSTKVETVDTVFLTPGQPPMYKIEGKQHLYTRNRLQQVKGEEAPAPEVIRGKPKTYVVEKILERRKRGNKVELKVKWRGYPLSEATWEPRARLLEDVPAMVKEFEASK